MLARLPDQSESVPPEGMGVFHMRSTGELAESWLTAMMASFVMMESVSFVMFVTSFPRMSGLFSRAHIEKCVTATSV